MEDKYGDKKKCIDFVFAIICRPLNEADQIIIKLFSWTPLLFFDLYPFDDQSLSFEKKPDKMQRVLTIICH